MICPAASPTSGSPSSPIRSRFTAAIASATSSILLLMLGDSSVFARIASVWDRQRLRKGVHGVLGNRLRSAKALGLAAHESLISRKTVAEVPLNGLSL